MATAAKGSTVKVAYTGRLKDGTVFDSSEGREPLEFVVGSGQVIPGFDEAVEGMQVGEKKTIEIACENAYGPHFDEGVMTVSRNDFPKGMDPKVGDRLQATQPDGRSMILSVTNTDDESVTLDANHPLAGEDLIFEIELLDVRSSLAI